MSMSIKLEGHQADALGSGSPPGRAWAQVLGKAAVVAGFFGVWVWVYDVVNAFAADPIRTIHLTGPASVFPWIIQPWTAVIYIPGGLIFAFAPFWYYRSWRGIALVLVCITLSSLISFLMYWAWPVSMVRPEFAGGTVGERLVRWFYSVDRPANCFPSLHVVFAVLGALLIARAGANRPARWFWWTLAAAVTVTTVTTGQHYFIDVPAGVSVAVVGYIVGLRVARPMRPSRS
jgi:membrane-associated phospholipid phosphatase